MRSMELAEESWVLLLDGSLARIRPLGPRDRDRTEAMHAQMSPDNRYLRFFGASPDAPALLAERICRPPDPLHCALGAWLEGELVGVADYERDPRTTAEAEMAVAVADRQHHKGIATLLLEHLASRARLTGVECLVAEVLVPNAAMLQVFADAGLRVERHGGDGAVTIRAYLDAGDDYLEAVARRERLAQMASLRHVFFPESVIVVGASERPGNVGGMVVRNLLDAGYRGRIAVVHPAAQQVHGIGCVKHVKDVGLRPDTAVIAVRAGVVPALVEECGKAGARSVVILTSGIDPGQGATLRNQCRRYGMRMVGPNCLGIATPGFGLNLTFTAGRVAGGSAGVAAQSGGIGVALAEHLARLGIGISTMATLGDKLDVSATDLMQFWYDDPGTRLALLYVESFGNPRKFARVAARLATQIPVLAVDTGRSTAAQRAVTSHTAAAATPAAARQALFADAGIVAVQDLGDLVDTVALLGHQPLPQGRGVAVISNAAGAAILAADACADAGLTLPDLAPVTRERLAEVLPPDASIANPLDASASCHRGGLARSVAILAADPGISAVVALPVPTGNDDFSVVPWPECGAAVVGIRLEQAECARIERTVPVYSSPRDAATALARAVQRTEWVMRPVGVPPPVEELPGFDISSARRIATRFLADHPRGGLLDPAGAVELLSCVGVTPVPVRTVTSAEEAERAAAELGLPVAVKAYGPELVHKHHARAIALGLGSGREAYTALARTHRQVLAGIVVQPMARGDIELLIGVNADSIFGPVVAFGLGGTEADALADQVVRLAPLTRENAALMVRSIRAAGALENAAQGEPVDLAALEDLLLRVSLLADRLPEIADMDLDPVLATAQGATIVDVKVRLQPRRPWDPFLRKLR